MHKSSIPTTTHTYQHRRMSQGAGGYPPPNFRKSAIFRAAACISRAEGETKLKQLIEITVLEPTYFSVYQSICTRFWAFFLFFFCFSTLGDQNFSGRKVLPPK